MNIGETLTTSCSGFAAAALFCCRFVLGAEPHHVRQLCFRVGSANAATAAASGFGHGAR
jgi:mevalonate pyrophosphate decarboxylase